MRTCALRARGGDQEEDEEKRRERQTDTHSMENKVPMTEFQTAKRHGHPALDISGEKYERTVLDDHFEIGIEELKDEVQIRL